LIESSVFAISKCATRITGLDQVLQGGLPAGRTSLLIGGPGAGKSLFSTEFLYRSALAGDAGVLVSFEERTDAVRQNAATLGWDLAALEQRGKLFLFEARIDPKAIVTGQFGIQSFLAILEHKLQAMDAKLVVLDALDVLMRLINDQDRVQNELQALHEWLGDRKITALLTIKVPRDSEQTRQYDFMDYMADCVICLDNRMHGQLSTRRLRVVKYRGSAFGSNEYPFVIGRPGITLLPISEMELTHQALGEKFSTGVPALDRLMYGGLRRGSSVLITGSSGTGKTTLCSTFAAAACARGENVLLISFEESAPALISAVLSSGNDLRPAIADGSLRLLTALPEAMGAEQHLVRAFALLDQFKPASVILESGSACKRMGSDQAAFEYLMRLITACKERGITILVTNQTTGFLNHQEISGIGMSSIIDTVILLRLAEEANALRRRLLVIKARGSAHSNRYHDFVITDQGLKLTQVPGDVREEL